ncbi:hypothetical protein evm_012333 [Chilo suppressalis]|nr:hypothetical protein evm_012333 [Chilo suppressalis]
MWYLITLLVLPYTSCHPVPDETSTINTVQLQRDLTLISYIQNFKNLMAEHVKSNYADLTAAEMEDVKEALEDFLKDFAKDLKETMEGVNNDVEETTEPNAAAFEDMKAKIAEEFPDVNEHTAGIIVAKLKDNLYRTRQKLDNIIKSSQVAAVENAQQ